MPNLRILIAGCGDVGTQLSLELRKKDHNITGLRRNTEGLPNSIEAYQGDLSQPETLLNLGEFDIVVYSVSANEYSEAGYRQAYVQGLTNVMAALKTPPKHIFFTSSTSVYAQSDSSWVDELSATEPKSYSGQVMLEAEKNAASFNIPATIVRFSGIYGPGRNHLLKHVQQGKGSPESPTLYSNRIHRDDCARALAYLIELVNTQHPIADLYLATDDCPSSMYDVSQWLANEVNVEITEFNLSRRAGSKRLNNMRLKATGFQFKYPSFREGYASVLNTKAP